MKVVKKVAEITQRGSRCPILGDIPGQIGQVSEQPDLIGEVSAYYRVVEVYGL